MSHPVPTPRIALLPEVVRNQIAAGEVIERPASAVKELVENAIDAGASQVDVDLEDGGMRCVRVRDNGMGMGAEDLGLCFEPHATSKLRTPDDLEHIASLGFRGEALASMGSIARCSVFSRPPGTEFGREILNEGGTLSQVREAGGAEGTVVTVRDLFYNTPARRRFLKRASTELSRCLDVVQRAALAHAGIGFSVTHGGKRVYDVAADMDFLGRIRRTFGAELADALVEVRGESGSTTLFGYVAPPRFSRRDTARQMWFLNGRSLRDKVLTRVLKDGFRGFLVEGRQPVAFLQLALDPAVVDVNVHPAKAEVRFREQRALFGFLVNALREAVAQTDMSTPGETMLRSMERRELREAGQAMLPNPGPLRSAPGGGGGERAPREPFTVREVEGTPYVIPGRSSSRPAEDPAATTSTSPHSLGASGAPGSTGSPGSPSSIEAPDSQEWAGVDDLRGPYLQVDRTYIVRALPSGFEIIDQHALHERVTFESLRRDVREGRMEIQTRLVPELVEASRADVELISGHLEALRTIGLEIAVFGETTLAVHGLPARLRNPDVEGIVRDVLEVVRRTGKPPEAEDVLEELLHSAACRSSIMAGDHLEDAEIEALLRRARELETDQTCPHARPTRVKFALADLEKAFHRR